MIFFLTTWGGRSVIDRYLASWGRPFFWTIQPVTYERFLAQPVHHPAVYVFSDLELAGEDVRRRAGEAYEAMRARGGRVRFLNHPTRTLRRYELLSALSAQGINTFRAYRADEPLEGVRFPVFLRGANDHLGSRTELLHTHEEVAASLASLRALRVKSPEWMVVEFCDTADAQGLYRKYSAFRVGDRMLARHVFFSRRWCLKHADSLSTGFAEEEWAYLSTNPHREQLLAIFRLAGIEYGRIDYSLLHGRIQVWEINTNPIILALEHYAEPSRRRMQEVFAAQLAEVWRELDRGMPSRPFYAGQRLRTAVRLGREIVRWQAARLTGTGTVWGRPGR